MKTHKNLYHQIYSFSNILAAAEKAKKGKKLTEQITEFHFDMETNLLELSRELGHKTYQPGEYKTFYIHDPKKRMISAAPYQDRVVHHALCNVIEPLFERTFIFDSYANRKGKGTHKAIERFQYFARIYRYVLKCDIKKFFPSIDHQILKKEIQWKIRCQDTLWLIDRIIDNSNPQEEHIVWFPGDDLKTPVERRKGLPIGNLTSQFWGNVYMNRFDHYMLEVLRVDGYIRYVDDFVIFSDDKARLHRIRKEISRYLTTLRLIVHPDKTQVFSTRKGVPFLGFMIFPDFRYVRKEKVKRYFRYIRKTLKTKNDPAYDFDKLECMLNSWSGHLKFGRHYYGEKRVVDYICSHGVNLVKHPNGSWRILEQRYRQLYRFQPQQEESTGQQEQQYRVSFGPVV